MAWPRESGTMTGRSADWLLTMIDELEALVGYVFIVGGRAVSATPPGALVELPPRKVQRSREQDTFFALISPAGPHQGQAAFYEQLAQLAAELYFRSGGSVTSALREAIGAVNNQMLEYNQDVAQPFEISVICLVLRGHEVYSARAGSSLCLLRQGDSFLAYPEDPQDTSPKLSGSALPDIRLSRYEVLPGHVMALADSGLARADRDQLREALSQADIPAIIESLKKLSGKDTQAMVIEFVSTDTPNPVSTPVPRTTSARAPAAAPVAVEPPPVEPALEPPLEGETADVSETLPADASVAVETGPEPKKKPSEPVSRRAVGGLGNLLAKVARSIGYAIDRILPEPSEDGGPRIPAMLAAALAILVPVIVVFIVVALRLSQVDLTQFEQQVSEVEAAAKQAESVSLDDRTHARAVWQAVLQRVDLVEGSTGRSNDPTLMRVRAQAQRILDTFDKVTRRTPVPLRNFGAGARLASPVVRGGADVYTLDLNENAIYRDTLNPNAAALLTRNAQPVVQRGQAVGAYSVRQLADMIWLPEGGVQRQNVLAALDTQGILITYSPTFAPATSQRLAGVDLWNKPVAISTWRGNLYVLDPGSNQIWRYRPVGFSYPNPPENYFASEEQPDLSKAVDFGIDVTGNIYIFFSDGQLKKYTSGTEQRFGLNGLPDNKPLQSGSAIYVDTDSTLPAIYLLDPVDQSVYQVTLSGVFKYRFRADDTNTFRDLNGIYADGANIYVAAGPMLYYFSIADLVNKP